MHLPISGFFGGNFNLGGIQWIEISIGISIGCVDIVLNQLRGIIIIKYSKPDQGDTRLNNLLNDFKGDFKKHVQDNIFQKITDRYQCLKKFLWVLFIYPLNKLQAIYLLAMVRLAKAIALIILLSTAALSHSATISIDSSPQSGNLKPDQVSSLASIAGVDSNDGNGASTTFDANSLDRLTQNIDQMLSSLDKAPPSASQDQSDIPSATNTTTTTNGVSTWAQSNSTSIAEPSNSTSGNDAAPASDKQSNSNSSDAAETNANSSSSEQTPSNSSQGSQTAESNTTTQSNATQENKTIVSTADNGANNKVASSSSDTTSLSNSNQRQTSNQTSSSTSNSTTTNSEAPSSSNDQTAKKSGICSSDQECANAYGSYVQQGLILTCNSSGVCEAQ